MSAEELDDIVRVRELVPGVPRDLGTLLEAANKYRESVERLVASVALKQEEAAELHDVLEAVLPDLEQTASQHASTLAWCVTTLGEELGGLTAALGAAQEAVRTQVEAAATNVAALGTALVACSQDIATDREQMQAMATDAHAALQAASEAIMGSLGKADLAAAGLAKATLEATTVARQANEDLIEQIEELAPLTEKHVEGVSRGRLPGLVQDHQRLTAAALDDAETKCTEMLGRLPAALSGAPEALVSAAREVDRSSDVLHLGMDEPRQAMATRREALPEDRVALADHRDAAATLVTVARVTAQKIGEQW